MLLMTPGPTAVDPRVIAAMNRPAIAHYHPHFFEVLDRTMEMLKTIFGTSGDVIVLPGGGRVGMEAAIASIVEPGDRLLHIVNGLFGELFVEIARRVGADNTLLESGWGQPLNLERVEDALQRGRFKALTVVHSETSVGAQNPIGEIGKICEEHDVLYVVDAVSSLACMPLKMDEMGIDLCITASQKGLGGIIGLSMVGVSERAYEVMRQRSTPCQSFALDLCRWREMFFDHEYPRPYPVVPSTHLVYALHKACEIILEEGLETRFQRHRSIAEATRRAIEALGLELFPQRQVATESLTAVRPPEGLEEGEITALMRDKYDVMIGGGLRKLKGQLFRISHMGVQASAEYLTPTLVALERALADLGYPVVFGTSVNTFMESLVSSTKESALPESNKASTNSN